MVNNTLQAAQSQAAQTAQVLQAAQSQAAYAAQVLQAAQSQAVQIQGVKSRAVKSWSLTNFFNFLKKDKSFTNTDNDTNDMSNYYYLFILISICVIAYLFLNKQQ
jgi:hypothetical protein